MVFLHFCEWYGLLPDQQTRRPSSFSPPIWWRSRMTPWLATCMQSEPFTLPLDICNHSKMLSHCSRAPKLVFIHELLLFVKLFYNLEIPAQQVLWTALTVSHFGILYPVGYTIYNKAFNPTWHLCIQYIKPQFTTSVALNYVSVYLKISKTDPFWQEMQVIIGCSDTQVWSVGLCGLHMLQCHCINSLAPNTSFFQIVSILLTMDALISHITFLLMKLGLNPALYSRYSMRIWGVTTPTVACLADWEIKSLEWWRSNTYQSYIRDAPDM